MSDDTPTVDSWRDLDAAADASAAVAYLDAAATVLRDVRLRSHEALRVQPGDTVLDAGCGTGIALREIADIVGAAGTVVGLDPSTAMLAAARARLADAPAAFELVPADVLDTGLPADRFDAVRTERVLMHVEDPAAALRELARVTKPGGRVVLVEPDHRRLAIDTDHVALWSAFIEGFATMLPNISAGLRAPSDAVLAGLTVESIEPVPYQFRELEGFQQVFQLDMGRAALLSQGYDDVAFGEFVDDLRRRDREGRFLAVGMMYIVTVEKGA